MSQLINHGMSGHSIDFEQECKICAPIIIKELQCQLAEVESLWASAQDAYEANFCAYKRVEEDRNKIYRTLVNVVLWYAGNKSLTAELADAGKIIEEFWDVCGKEWK